MSAIKQIHPGDKTISGKLRVHEITLSSIGSILIKSARRSKTTCCDVRNFNGFNMFFTLSFQIWYESGTILVIQWFYMSLRSEIAMGPFSRGLELPLRLCIIAKKKNVICM
jgi:hypothetical protein